MIEFCSVIIAACVNNSNETQSRYYSCFAFESAGRSWTVAGQHHHSMEATAYAVLALVKAKDFDKAGEAVHWLRSQQSHYGGSDTTQVH